MNFRYIVEGAGVGVPFSATTVVGAGVDLTISLRINSKMSDDNPSPKNEHLSQAYGRCHPSSTL